MTTADLLGHIKKHPLGFGCGVLCIILGGFLYFRADAEGEKQAEYEAKSVEAARIVSNVTTSKNLPEQVAEIQALANDLEGRLVRGSQLAANQQFFYKLEKDTEVKLVDVRQNSVPKKAGGTYQGIPFNVTVQGPYKQVMTFLNRLENGPHLCRFTGAVFGKMTPGGDAALQNGITLTLNLELLGQP